ncbi:3-keto-5-aminohexanoate cleavage protein [Mycetocola zhujimingii]|nr:3-keto-5-aminohexanoate cleavage protein [Mycetocola zhujimingii]
MLNQMDRSLLQACLNGARPANEHPRLSATPMTAEAIAAVRAGARSLHVHPKNSRGDDSLESTDVASWVAALRASCPGIPIGVTTGEWTAPDAAARLAMISAWSVLPDFASVNWHEDGADDVARLLLDRGVGVEAGIWNIDGARRWASSPIRSSCLRTLIEVADLPGEVGKPVAEELIALVRRVDPTIPILLHGEERSTWPILGMAVSSGLDTRIGLEDTLELPDGSLAHGNGELVTAAAAIAAERMRPRQE